MNIGRADEKIYTDPDSRSTSTSTSRYVMRYICDPRSPGRCHAKVGLGKSSVYGYLMVRWGGAVAVAAFCWQVLPVPGELEELGRLRWAVAGSNGLVAALATGAVW